MLRTKLHRHFDVDGKELEPTYIEVSDAQLAEEAKQAKRERAIQVLEGLTDVQLSKLGNL